MKPLLWLFAVPAVLGAAATWAGVTARRGAAVAKALVPLSLLGLAVAAIGSGSRPVLAAAVALGLLFCAAADYLLGRPDNAAVFVYGLAGFLVAYLIYGAGLAVDGVSWTAVAAAGAALAGVAALQYRTFRTLPDSLRLPVLVYMAVVSFLAASAAGFAWGSPGAPAGRALVLAGSLLIYLSDSLIAHNLFRAPLPASDLYVLPPYYIGQICIVLALHVL